VLEFREELPRRLQVLDDKTELKVAEVWDKRGFDRDAKIAGATAEDLKTTLTNAEAVAADHMDDINSKLSTRCICRFLDCGFYGRSQSWASSIASGGYQLKCPKCAVQCRAFASSSALTKAHMCLEVKDFHGDKGRNMEVDQADNSIMIHQDDGTVDKLWLMK
jgi:hypothetical protein